MSLLRPIDIWRAPAPLPERVAWLGEWTYAHRGLHGTGIPENSRAAFSAAIARGLGIECDIQRSVDGKAMVFHDWDLERLTGTPEPVAHWSSRNLSNLSLGESEEFIPLLSETLTQIGGQVPLLIEIKSREDYRYRPICLEVRRALEGYRGQAAVMSFDPRICRWFGENARHVLRGLVVTEDGQRTLTGRLRRHLALWHARPDFLAYDVRDLPSAFAAAQRRRGLPVLTWTVRSAELAERAAAHADAPIAEGAGIEAGS